MSFSQNIKRSLGAIALLALCAGQAGADLLSLSITSATNWKQSTQVDYNDAVPWGGVSSLPAPGTFTLPTEVYTDPHVQSVGWGATTLYAGPGVRYFQGLLNIPEVASIAADLGISVDNDVEIYINRHLLVREGSLDPENFGAPHLSVSLGFAGQVDNGSFGNQPFDWAAPTFPATNWISGGVNEVILVVRNLSGTDSGGFSFVMNIAAKTNNAPVANNDAVTTNEDTPIDIAVLANDTDPDGDALYVVDTGMHFFGTKGRAVIVANQQLRYTPNANQNGSDSFNYSVIDGHGHFATAHVDVTVLPVNDPPVANNDAAMVARGQAVTINVMANDGDVEGDALVMSSVSTPAKGTAVISDGKVVYTSNDPTPKPNPETDSFTYTLSDGQGGSATGTVNLTLANPLALSVPPGPLAIKQGMGLRVTANATTSNTGQPVVVSAVNRPPGADFVSISSGCFFDWTPAFDQAGTYTVYFQARAPGAASIAKSVTVSVSPNRYPDLVVGGSRDFFPVPNYTYSEESVTVPADSRDPLRPNPIRIEQHKKEDGYVYETIYTYRVATFTGYTPSFTGPAGVEIRQKYPRHSATAFHTFSGANGLQRAQELPATFGAFLQGWGNTRPAIGNLDGVGLSEFVVGGGPGSAGQLAVYSPTGNWTKTVQVNAPGYNAYNGETRPAVGDLDGDGKAEIVVGLGKGGWGALPVFVWQGTELVLPFQVVVDDGTDYNRLNGETRPALGDLNGDGKADLVVGRGAGGGGRLAVFVSSPTGHAFKGWLVVRMGNGSIFTGETRPAMGDLDGDGRAEIVVMHPAGLGASSPGVAVFTSEGRQVAYTAVGNAGWPAIGDVLTPDGKGEIVWGAEGSKSLLSATVTRNGTEWSLTPGPVIATNKFNPIPVFGKIAGVPQ